MQISFTCTTNKEYTMIHKAIFVLPNGTKISVDRDETDFVNEISKDKTTRWLTMDWDNCYLCDINSHHIFCDEDENGQYLFDENGIIEFTELIRRAYVVFELEGDAPDEDYQVNIESFSVDGIQFTNHPKEKLKSKHSADVYAERLAEAVMDSNVSTYYVTENLIDKYNSETLLGRNIIDDVFSALTGMTLKEFVED